MKILADLLPLLKKGRFLIQTHNFPDHDAVASAFALQYFLGLHGIECELTYEGAIQRSSLQELIAFLDIAIEPASQRNIRKQDKIIIVDGCKGNKNVTDLIGNEIAVIDHHQVARPENVPFVDIRPEIGACSSIIYSYFQEASVAIPRSIATALLTGIQVDTALMTRGVDHLDLSAYADLYTKADIGFVNSNLRNSIQEKDLSFYRNAIEKVRIQDAFAFCYFEEGCNQNLLGIIGDFFLALQEVDFVFLCANNIGQINCSARSEQKYWNAGEVVQELLRGIGFGGGHADMAGGIIKNLSFFNPDDLFLKLSKLLAGFKKAYLSRE
ncbi:MAG: DHH family phosphoesterase [Spirochaetales bacterium]|nr:DHH family phosphoesterase [Spirochaetales bacterium]